MKRKMIFLLSLAFLFSLPAEAKKRKRRKKLRKWSISVSNGYTFYQKEKNIFSGALQVPAPDPSSFDGQMDTFFSSLEIARNFGYYEIGGRLQYSKNSFFSPFVKWNFIKNKRRNDFVPFLILGVSPSALMGFYGRAGLNLFFNRYFAFSPFVGWFFWFKAKRNLSYKPKKHNFYFNGGVSVSLYFR